MKTWLALTAFTLFLVYGLSYVGGGPTLSLGPTIPPPIDEAR